MKHILDTLLIKLLFFLITLLFLFVFRKIHIILATREIKNSHKKIFPNRNHVDSIYFFSRLLAIGVLVSPFSINIYQDLMSNLLHFISWTSLSMLSYFISLYIIEGIILHPFEYIEEVHSKKNYTYVIISSTLALCTAFLVKATILQSGFSLLLTTVTYALILVLFILLLKLYPLASQFNLKNSISKHRISASFSFAGYIIGITIICLASLKNSSDNSTNQLVQILTQILLGIILFPLFKKSIVYIFKINEKTNSKLRPEPVKNFSQIGYGIFEGSIFCLASVFTSLLMPTINITTALPYLNSTLPL